MRTTRRRSGTRTRMLQIISPKWALVADLRRTHRAARDLGRRANGQGLASRPLLEGQELVRLFALVLPCVAVSVASAQDPGLTAPSPSKASAIRGVDVSVYQGKIDWTKVASSGIKFAFIRAGDGMSKDSRFQDNWTGAKAAGITRGAYQFFRAKHDGAQQANQLCDMLTDAGELAP